MIDTPADWFRLASTIVLWLCIAQMVGLIYVYCKVAIPLRKRLGEINVLTPPIWWTLAYHVGITTLLVLFSVTSIILIATNQAISPAAFIAPFVVAAFTFTANRFYRYYIQVMRGSLHPGLYAPKKDER